VLYANTISLPALLQSLFGYDATTSGLVLSPAGIFAIVMLVVAGALLSRAIDARYLMASGLITIGAKELLDGTPQSRYQSVTGGLAESGGDHGTFDAIRPT
jgi:hypothetical protein